MKSNLMTMTAAMLLAASGQANAGTPQRETLHRETRNKHSRRTDDPRSTLGDGAHRRHKRIARWKTNSLHRIVLQRERQCQPHGHLHNECRRKQQPDAHRYSRKRKQPCMDKGRHENRFFSPRKAEATSFGK